MLPTAPPLASHGGAGVAAPPDRFKLRRSGALLGSGILLYSGAVSTDSSGSRVTPLCAEKLSAFLSSINIQMIIIFRYIVVPVVIKYSSFFLFPSPSLMVMMITMFSHYK